ncbi:MAG: FISUMP domain-containing protein [Desulfotignum sp.]|nr:FISUMP domain-containing protein [Desulfotignum sp.]
MTGITPTPAFCALVLPAKVPAKPTVDLSSGWDSAAAHDGAWSDSTKTDNDPCPDGFRVPTRAQWDGVLGNSNNIQSTVGTWSDSATNYGSARFFGSQLMLPAAGSINGSSGALGNRGFNGRYWSSSKYLSNYACSLDIGIGNAIWSNRTRSHGFSVRCISE